MRGASALQDVLASEGEKPIRAFVVWEPILVTDVARPTNKVLSLVSDRRVSQYWDPKRLLSGLLVAAAVSDPGRLSPGEKVNEDDVAWDVVAVYPPGVRWDPQGLSPRPFYYGYPVVEAIEGLRRALANPESVGALPTAPPARSP